MMEEYILDKLDFLKMKWCDIQHSQKTSNGANNAITVTHKWTLLLDIRPNEINTLKHRDNWDAYMETSYDFWTNFIDAIDNLDYDYLTTK